MANRSFWTQERLIEAFQTHLDFHTMREVADELSSRWKTKLTSNAVSKALRDGFPDNNFRETIGTTIKKAEEEERKNKALALLEEARASKDSRRADYNIYTTDELRRKHIIPCDENERGDLIWELEGGTSVFHCWPDAHVPDHDRAVVEACILFAEYMKPDGVVDLGDFLELSCVSAHGRSTVDEEELSETLNIASDLLESLGERLDRAGVKKRAYIFGNHENRLHRYIVDKAPELYTTYPTLQEMLRLRESGWEFVSYGGRLRVGRVSIHHGQSHSKYVAARTMEKEGPMIIGHTHRAQVFAANTRPGYPEIGMTCGTRGSLNKDYQYHAKNDHVHAMGILTTTAEGFLNMNVVMIDDGVLRYPIGDGKVLECDGNIGETREV